jgi:muconolactone delta-isomerase
MNRVLVITYPKKDDRIASVMAAEYAMRPTPGADQGIIEHLFAKENDGGGVVVFNETSVEKVQALIAQLRCFFFEKGSISPLNKIY